MVMILMNGSNQSDFESMVQLVREWSRIFKNKIEREISDEHKCNTLLNIIDNIFGRLLLEIVTENDNIKSYYLYFGVFGKNYSMINDRIKNVLKFCVVTSTMYEINRMYISSK